jgi:hypothetical protein
MRILIVSNSYKPVQSPRSFRTTELVEELVRRGFEVHVVTNRNSEFDYENYRINRQDKIGFYFLDKVKWQSINTQSNNLIWGFVKKVVSRILEQYLHYPMMELKFLVARKLKSLNAEYDVLISIASPHTVHWGVASALKNNKKLSKIWIADCGDPFMLADNMQYRQPFYFKFFELNFCKLANYITVPTDQSYLGYYPSFWNKIITIPQGFKFFDYTQNCIEENEDKQNKHLKICYAGSLNEVRRNPTEFIKYLESTGIQYEFNIYTNNPKCLNSLKHLFGIKIFIYPYIPREELLTKLSNSDFLMNFQNEGLTQSPSKLIDYGISGRPILSIKSSNFDSNIIDEFLRKDYKNAYKIEDIDRYRIENVVNKFVKLF